MTNQRVMNKLEKEHGKVFDLVLTELIKQVDKLLLAKNNTLSGFDMGMGVWMFHDKNGEIIHSYEQWACMNRIEDFICKWDSIYHITGHSIEINNKLQRRFFNDGEWHDRKDRFME